MLMDILMESLMSMDEDTLDYVLESCSDEEIELIDGAMEQMNINKLERRYAKAAGTAVAKYYRCNGINHENAKHRSKGDKDVAAGKDVAIKQKTPDGNFLTDVNMDKKAMDRFGVALRKRTGKGSVSVDESNPYSSAAGYAFDRAIGRRAGYDAGIRATDPATPTYSSKKEELVDRLKNTARYKNRNS